MSSIGSIRFVNVRKTYISMSLGLLVHLRQRDKMRHTAYTLFISRRFLKKMSVFMTFSMTWLISMLGFLHSSLVKFSLSNINFQVDGGHLPGVWKGVQR